jgi:hypothetical protein
MRLGEKMQPIGEASGPGLKKLRLRYAGTCVECGAALAQGTEALYHAATKTVRCVTCPDPQTAVEAAPIDGGTAGASARREYERRAAKREVETRERWGNRLGGVVLALTDEPQSTRAWAKGARGEERLARALDGIPDVVVLSDRKVPGTRGNIDHLIVGPAGLFVVDAKYYKGSLKIRDVGGFFRTDNRLYVGGRDCSKLADNMCWQVAAVEALLASIEVVMPVTPVLCFIDVEWPLLFPPDSFRGVRLEDARSLRKLIAAPPALDAAAVDKLARILATGFPAK